MLVGHELHDVKTVYGDRRFGKEVGLTHDVPRMHEMNVNDPDLLVNMDPPRQTRSGGWR